MAKDKHQRKEKLTQAGLLNIAKKQELHTLWKRRVTLVIGVIALVCAGVGIGVWLFVSLILFPAHSLWEWVPGDVPFALSLDMTQMHHSGVTGIVWGNKTDQSLLAHIDTLLHSVFGISPAVPIVQGEEALVFLDRATSAVVLGLKAQPESLDTFIGEISRDESVSIDKGKGVSSITKVSWVRPYADTLLLSTSAEALDSLFLDEKRGNNLIVKPRFYYNPLTRRAPFVNAYIHSKSFPADNPYLSALVHGVAGNAGKVWMSASSVDTGIRGMISVQQNSSFRPLVKKFIMRDGVLGMGVVGDMSALSRYPVLNTLVSGAALYNNKPYFHAMAPDVSDFMVGPGVIVVRSLAPIKTVVIVPDTNMSFDFSAFEERIRVFLARSVPEEKDVILPDGSKARQLRASDKVFQWIGSDATLATGEKVVIRSLPDNPGDIHFAYARVQTQPSVLVFAPDPRDISETLPLINVFSQAIEQARAYPESVDAFFSPDSVPKAFAPYLQGVKSFHVYQRSAQSEILFDIESYNRD